MQDDSNAPAHPDRHYTIMVLVLSVITAAIFLQRYLELIASGMATPFTDFAFFSSAAHKLAAGDIASIYSPETARHYLDAIAGLVPFAEGTAADHPFVYPPPMLLLLWPLGFLPHTQAAIMWFGIGAAALFLALMGLPKFLFPHLPAKKGKYAVLVLALSIPAALLVILSGQTGLLTSALLIAGLGLLKSRPQLAGLCLGALIIKPHLALLVPIALIAAKEWRVLQTAMGVAVILAILPMVLWGMQVWQGFFAMLPLQAELVATGHPRLMQMMVSFYAAMRLFGYPHALSLVAQAVMLLLAAIMVWKLFKACEDEGLRIAVLVAASFIASPYVFIYDLPAMALPLMLLADRGLGDRLSMAERNVFALACFITLVAFQINALYFPLSLLTNIALCLVLWQRVKRKT